MPRSNEASFTLRQMLPFLVQIGLESIKASDLEIYAKKAFSFYIRKNKKNNNKNIHDNSHYIINRN